MPSDAREELKFKLKRLQKRRPDVFGALGHRFELAEPAGEGALAEFEREHQIVLPEDYRWFLSEIGNGGAGPYYGVFALGEMDDGHGMAAWKEDDGFVGRLRDPFPHTEAWNDVTGQPDEEDYEPDSLEYEAAFNAFDERYFSPRNVDGAFPICHLGCALRIWLVVTGPERGRLWLDKRPDYEGLTPLRSDFLSWYTAWVDESGARA